MKFNSAFAATWLGWAALSAQLMGANAAAQSQSHAFLNSKSYVCMVASSGNSLKKKGGRKLLTFRSEILRARNRLAGLRQDPRTRANQKKAKRLGALVRELKGCRDGKAPFTYETATPRPEPTATIPADPTPPPDTGEPAADSDDDGLPDEWERRQLKTLSYSGDEDPDQDGLINAAEFAYGLAPLVKEANLVLNHSFNEGLQGWFPFSNGAQNFSGIGLTAGRSAGDLALKVENTDGANIGVIQRYRFASPTRTPLFISYWVKSVVRGAALQTLDVRINYVDSAASTYEYLLSPFMPASSEVGLWVHKQFILYPARPVESLDILLLNYGAVSEAVYDDVIFYALPEHPDETLDLGAGFSMRLNPSGYIASISRPAENGNEHLLALHSLPFALMNFSDGSSASAVALEKLEEDSYQVRFFDGVRADLTAMFNVVSRENDYVEFRVESVVQPYSNKQLRRIEFATLSPTHYAGGQFDRVWALAAAETEPFLNVVPLSIGANCSDEFSPGGRKFSCGVAQELGFAGGRIAVTVSMKKDFFERMAAIAQEQALHLGSGTDGLPIFRSAQIRDSYLFAAFTSSNHRELLDYARRGGFRQFLAIEPLRYGTYTVPAGFPSLQDFYAAVDAFHDAGVDFGIHTHYFQVSPYTANGIVDFARPHLPLADVLWTESFASLAQSITASSPAVSVDRDPLESDAFMHFYFGTEINGGNWGRTFLIDDEIVVCQSFSGTTLECTRGQHKTVPAAHAGGAPIHILPQSAYNAFHLNPANPALVEAVHGSFAGVVNRTRASMLYLDGLPAPFPAGLRFIDALSFSHKAAVLPMLDRLGRIPLLQFGAGAPSYGALYQPRVATDDGVVFKPYGKNRTKAQSLANANPFALPRPELGWWKFYGAHFSVEGDCRFTWDCRQFDHDAVTEADVHYGMSKVYAADSSVGLELVTFYERHRQLLQRLDLVKLYHDLIELDARVHFVPPWLKTYLKDPDVQVRLTKQGGMFSFIRQAVTRAHLTWNSDGPASVTAANPFGAQKLKFELRARPDFLPSSDANHLILADLSSPSGISLRASSAAVSCSLGAGGSLVIYNGDSTPQGCSISLPRCSDASSSLCNSRLSSRRGFGISMIGDGSRSLVVLRLQNGNFETRDFPFVVDFFGPREVIAAEATTAASDYVQGQRIRWYLIDQKARSWDFNWSYPLSMRSITMFISAAPGTTSNLQITKIRALAENGLSELKNPRVGIAQGSYIQFPVSLFVADDPGHPNFLEYDGDTGEYEVYTSNYELVAKGKIDDDPLVLSSGLTELEVESDVSLPYSARAELSITAEDDANNDDVADDSSYRVTP